MAKKRAVFGFTLIELLVVMAIIAILTTLGGGAFRTTNMKARDARRKSDLKEIQKAIESYVNDDPLQQFPAVIPFGAKWEFVRDPVNPNDTTAVYMELVPQEEKPGWAPYCYEQATTTNGFPYYALYAQLENTNDSQAVDPPYPSVACPGYNYRVASADAS